MGTHDELLPLLKKLRLSGVLETLDLRTREAVQDEAAYGDFLLRLVRDEVERRDGKQMAARLRRASSLPARVDDHHLEPRGRGVSPHVR